jgi:quinoprotein glucose dehydrogenase
VTASGLVFIAATMDSRIRAFAIETGAELWQDTLPASGQAGPMTYTWQGKQYLLIAAGGHAWMDTPRGDYYVAYTLEE